MLGGVDTGLQVAALDALRLDTIIDELEICGSMNKLQERGNPRVGLSFLRHCDSVGEVSIGRVSHSKGLNNRKLLVTASKGGNVNRSNLCNCEQRRHLDMKRRGAGIRVEMGQKCDKGQAPRSYITRQRAPPSMARKTSCKQDEDPNPNHKTQSTAQARKPQTGYTTP